MLNAFCVCLKPALYLLCLAFDNLFCIFSTSQASSCVFFGRGGWNPGRTETTVYVVAHFGHVGMLYQLAHFKLLSR